MKKIIPILVMLAAVLAAYAYVHPGVIAWLKQFPDVISGNAANTTTLYQWQDPDGNWHLTTRRPPGGISYRALKFQRSGHAAPKPGSN
ncbi:MAG: hypothetical protein KGJ12_07680 [Gammaproteobacteria bacterium]|nr:hypothetical protein [Gammaproteobacteria bacterium]